MSATRNGSIDQGLFLRTAEVKLAHGAGPVPAGPVLTGPVPLGRPGQRTVEIVLCRLWASGWQVLKQISCEEHEGVVVLRGQVPTFYLKQMAQTLVSQVSGVEEIVNRIEVASHGKEIF